MGSPADVPKMKSLAVPRPELTAGDLSDEEWREYEFADGTVYRIDHPKILYLRLGGTTHRVVDETGLIHCVAFPGPWGSTRLRWKPKNPMKPVTF